MKNKLFQLYNSIIDTILPNCVVEFTEEDFECQIIPVSNFGTTYLIRTCLLSDYINEDIQERNISPYTNELFALLHEVGHCKTYSKKREKHYTKWEHIYSKCKNYEKAKKIHNNLAWEKMADGYALNFFQKNQELVKGWDLQIREILEKME